MMRVEIGPGGPCAKGKFMDYLVVGAGGGEGLEI